VKRKINRSKRRLRWERIALILFTGSLLGAAIFVLFRSRNEVSALNKYPAPQVSTCRDVFEERIDWINKHEKITFSIAEGESFYELLAGRSILPQDIIHVDQAIKPFYDLTKIKEGQSIDVWFNKEEERMDKVSFELSPDKNLYVTRNGAEFFAGIAALPAISVPAALKGEIKNSFYESAIESGMPIDIIMDIADVFAWDIDFLIDIRPGDTFQVLFAKHYRKGVCIGHGGVLAARFTNQQRLFSAFYFTDSKGRSSFYDRDGISLMKSFLKSPLRYRRISSYFSKRRFHPILKIYRPHYGVDYAAPVGTPVESIGDGRITFIGWKGGYGRYIKIRHNHIYESSYGHLSRFAKGLRNGSKVKQGDVIGFVGSSGLSTGPHLDFSLRKNGTYIDPLKIKSPPILKVSKEDSKSFTAFVEQMESLWQKDQES
jgi:murein DD-endopeptidase MepM/ murein hydrolase activator NlpD